LASVISAFPQNGSLAAVFCNPNTLALAEPV